MGDTPLDRLDQQVRDHYQKEKEKIEALHTRREVELAHCEYLRKNVCTASSSTSFGSRPFARRSPVSHVMGKQLICPVLNCGIVFTTEVLYREHLSTGAHSPCNPFKQLQNGRMESTITSHICPICGNMYMDYSTTLMHMKAMGHNVLHAPLKVACFACPHCLTLFPDKSSCELHMRVKNHSYIQYPFSDDITMPTKSKPVPFPVKTMELFINSCKSVKYWLTCRKCYEERERISTAHVHDKKRACADMDHGEVFANLLKSHTCIQCLCLFDDIPDEDKEHCTHRCSESVIGMYIENNCKTFEEFVRRLGLIEFKTKTQDIRNNIGENFASRLCSRVKKQKTGLDQESVKGNSSGQRDDMLMEIDDIFLARASSASATSGSSMDCIEIDCENNNETDQKNLMMVIENVANRQSSKSCNSVNLSCDNSTTPSMISVKKSDSITLFSHSSTTTSASVTKNSDCVNILSDICTNASTSGAKKSISVTSSATSGASGSDMSWCANYIADLPTNMSLLTSAMKKSKKKKKKKKNRSNLGSINNDGSSDITRTNKPPCSWGVDSFNFKPTLHMQNVSTVPFPQTGNQYGNVVSQQDFPRSSGFIRNSTKASMAGPQQPSQTGTQYGRELPPQDLPCSSNLSGTNAPKAGPQLQNGKIPSGLDTMRQIIFLDLDNWAGFFQKLPEPLSDRTFVWAFFGGTTNWKEPLGCRAFMITKRNGWFHLHNKCSNRKDAADFAICMWIGRMDERLPKHIPFIILSGDKGFNEIEEQMHHSERRAVVINPHHCEERMLLAMIKSVADA